MAMYQSDKFEGSALELARTAAGFELKELSEETEISLNRLAKLETGSGYPSKLEINILAKTTGVLPKFFNQFWVKAPSHCWNFRPINFKQ